MKLVRDKDLTKAIITNFNKMVRVGRPNYFNKGFKNFCVIRKDIILINKYILNTFIFQI
jgi:hypothetical protein